MNRAVFLDRDGTINENVDYPRSFEEIKIFPESLEAVRRLNKAGLYVIVVTNQSGVGRGLLSEEELESIHLKMRDFFLNQGARIDAFYYCPHWIESADLRYRKICSCRKPAPGLGQKAAVDFNLDLTKCFMIGDKIEDVLFGHRLGARAVLVLTGEGKQTLQNVHWFMAKKKAEGVSPEPARKEELEKGSGQVEKKSPGDATIDLLSYGKEKIFRFQPEILRPEELEPDYVATHILAAVDWLLTYI